MNVGTLDSFVDGIWLVDFEYYAPDGERPEPLCMVAREWRTGSTVRLWREELKARPEAPFPTGPRSLFVAYYASAELGCCLSLGWPAPARILDLCIEFKCLTSGMTVPCGRSLLGALAYYGIDGIDATEKETLRQLAMRGGPYSNEERAALLEYCESDVVALAKLLPAMLPQIDVPRALLRGRYMAAAASIEWNGVPIDTAMLGRLRASWSSIQERLIEQIDANYVLPDGRGIYEGRTFKADRFAEWLARQQIPWPQLESGGLDLKDDTFRQMARAFPQVSPLRELRHSLSELRLESLAVGSDGRNRCMLSAFGGRTGRNQPSNAKFIFGPSVWLRGLIQPPPGSALAYIDWAQQEFGIAAALSGDQAMMDAYGSGDPYLTFAKQAGAVPPDATKATHRQQRDQFKICALGVQYGMGEQSLALKINESLAEARQLLQLHRDTYPAYWRWSSSAVDHAMLHGWLQTVFGWRVHVGAESNPRSLANFPTQANGAEMLRLTCCLATERGVRVCAPVHDALLIEAPVERIYEVVAECQAMMREASRTILDGFELSSDVKVVPNPERFMDDNRGAHMWNTVQGLLPAALEDVIESQSSQPLTSVEAFS